MYQPRHLTDIPGIDRDAVSFPAALGTKPRRTAGSRAALLSSRIAPAVSVALLATTAGLTLNLGIVQAPPASATQNTAVSFTDGIIESIISTTVGDKYALNDLKVRAQASDDSALIGHIKVGAPVTVTDLAAGDYVQVSHNGQAGYVLIQQLGDQVPAPQYATMQQAPANSSVTTAYTGPTTYSGKRVLGLKPRAMVVYNAVMERWGGQINSVGGYRASSRSNHQYGGAIDFMLTPGKESGMGWDIARFLAANASAFHIDHIIFEQKVWTPSSSTWRLMENRGSATQNHMDHVHVSVKL